MRGPYCILFAGQGTQTPGMCSELWRLAPARDVLERLKPILGADIEHVTTRMPEEELALTYNAQRALHAHHLGHWVAFRSLHPEVRLDGAIGHSVGVVAALVAAGSLTIEDSALFIRERAKVFSELCLSLPEAGGMAAVSADSVEDVKEMLRSRPGVELALHNTAFRCVVAGSARALQDFACAARERSMRVTMLKVQGPYHTAAFAPCRDRLATAIEGIRIAMPKIPVFMGTSGSLESDPERIRELLVSQSSSPELHFDAVRSAYARGCHSFLEVAHKRSALCWLDEQLIDEEGAPLPDVEACAYQTEEAAAASAGRAAQTGGWTEMEWLRK